MLLISRSCCSLYCIWWLCMFSEPSVGVFSRCIWMKYDCQFLVCCIVSISRWVLDALAQKTTSEVIFKLVSHAWRHLLAANDVWLVSQTPLAANKCRQAWLTGLKMAHYASPSSGEAYRDRRLTTNFELWVQIFCVPTCFHVRIPKPCLSVHLSVHTPRKKKKSPWLRQYQSYISNWYING